jgi:hypothetical protein
MQAAVAAWTTMMLVGIIMSLGFQAVVKLMFGEILC